MPVQRCQPICGCPVPLLCSRKRSGNTQQVCLKILKKTNSKLRLKLITKPCKTKLNTKKVMCHRCVTRKKNLFLEKVGAMVRRFSLIKQEANSMAGLVTRFRGHGENFHN